MKRIALLLLLLSGPASAYTLLGTIVSDGTSKNLTNTSNVPAAGGTGAFTLPATSNGIALKLWIQCSADTWVKTGIGGALAVTKTASATIGIKLDAWQFFPVGGPAGTFHTSVAILPDAGAASFCTLWGE